MVTKKDSEAIKRSIRNIVLTNHYERLLSKLWQFKVDDFFELTTPGMAQMFPKNIKKSNINNRTARVSNVFIRAVDRASLSI